MAPLTQATGAHHISVKTMDRALDNVREAFHFAALERRPVVISIPMDLQKQAYPHMVDYIPSADYLPAAQRPQPDPTLVEKLVEMIAAAEKPIIIAGRGAKLSKAREAIEEMAEAMGARGIVVITRRGVMAGCVTNCRPFKSTIYAFTNDGRACRQMALNRGVVPHKIAFSKDPEKTIASRKITNASRKAVNTSTCSRSVSGNACRSAIA
jgi:glyoxylate carboligase